MEMALLISSPPLPEKVKNPGLISFFADKTPGSQYRVQGLQQRFPSPRVCLWRCAVADFDGDGKLEIAIAMHETGIRIFSNQGKGPCGPWEEVQNLPQTMVKRRTRAIVAADMNKDGRVDLVALAEAAGMNASENNTAGIAICWNEAAGWRTQQIEGSEGLFGDDIAIGEVNGDGTPDIAIGSLDDQRPQFVWLSDGNGKWQAASAEGFASNIVAWSVQLVDLDNDGKDELLLGVGGAPMYKNGGPRVYRWDGTRWNYLSQGLPQVSWVSGVAAVDFDGDGRKGIVAAGMYTGTVKVYSLQSDSTWVERLEIKEEKLEKVRNYKVRSFRPHTDKQDMIVANYAGERYGTITAWSWR